MIEHLLSDLERDEGLRLTMYDDSRRVPTLGYGHNLRVEITKAAAQQILSDDVDRVIDQLDQHLPWWKKLNAPRQAALANMAFNLGISGLLRFTHMLNALQSGDWITARDQALNSLWAKQVGARAHRIARQFQTGEYQ